MSKVLNFDKFIQEKNRETIDVTVLGKTYKVAAEIPAIVPVMMARSEATDDKQLATRMVMRAADAMFGKDAVNEMCDNGLSAANLADLVQRLFEQINTANTDDDDESEELSDDDNYKAARGGKNSKK